MKKLIVTAIALALIITGCSTNTGIAPTSSQNGPLIFDSKDPKNVAENIVAKDNKGATNITAIDAGRAVGIYGDEDQVYVEYDNKDKDSPAGHGCNFISLKEQADGSWVNALTNYSYCTTQADLIVTEPNYENEAKLYLDNYAKTKSISIDAVYKILYFETPNEQHAIWYFKYTTKKSETSFGVIDIFQQGEKWSTASAQDEFLTYTNI